MPIEITPGFTDAERPVLAGLYWQAFGAKLGRVMGPQARALRFIERVMQPDHALVAREGATVLGVAGFKTAQGAFVGGDFTDLRAVYGGVGALWRAAALSLLERDVETRRLLMDGICVADAARGRGIGTRLLHAIFDEARSRGCPAVRLDVIDSNPRARALYEREGFQPVGEDHLGPLRWLFGFRSATKMVRAV